MRCSTIQSGPVALARAPHPLEAIAEAATDMFAAIAIEQGLSFESNLEPGLSVVECDSERALQVMAHQVANALKVPPPGGRIAIGAKPKSGREPVVFFVNDTSPACSSGSGAASPRRTRGRPRPVDRGAS